VNLEPIEQQGFDLLETVDETSQTIAWKAVQRTLERTVILRILKPEAAADPVVVNHFLSIARTVARIKSESVASIFDIVSTGDLHYVVMEYVEGPTLEELVAANGPLPAERALRIAAALVASLEPLWESARIVHRNLKSSTIRLATRGVAKLTDFSLAIQAGPGVNATALDGGNIVGTPCFLSPEQAVGSHTLTTQSDMYALGVVLYHLTTGIVPFEQQDVVSILAAHVKQQIPPPHHLNPSVPVSFSWLLHRLMMKNPDDRYPDWQAALHDIRFLLAGERPSCVRPDEASPSTIAAFDDDGAQDAAGETGPQIRLKKRKRSSRFAAYQSKAIRDEHASEIRRATLVKEAACWLALILWLTAVLWFRAVYQADGAAAGTPPEGREPEAALEPGAREPAPAAAEAASPDAPTGTETAGQPPASTAGELSALPITAAPSAGETPTPQVAGETPALQTESPPLPSGIPAELASRLARAFADGSLQAAREAVQTASARFQERDRLAGLLDRVPEPDALVADYLHAQIGKPLIFERSGKQRTVIPREVADGTVRLEANGRGIDIPIRDLSADEKLRWMERPKDEPQSVAYCLALMRSSRRGEIPARAAACPLLAPVLTEAAALVTAQ
jgi:serine/threonine-protein kinase